MSRLIAPGAALAALLALLLFVGCARRPPPGEFPLFIEEGRRQTAQGASVEYTLHLPPEGWRREERFPTVILVHGFARHRGFHRGTAERLARTGIAVLTPDMTPLLGGESARESNALMIVDHLRWLTERARNPRDPLFGRLDPDWIAFAGHSAGGAVCIEAAALAQQQQLAPAALVLLDAVPWPRTAKSAQAMAELPVLSLRAEPGPCNARGAIRDILPLFPFPVEDWRVVGAGHCDAENPTNALCEGFCGGSKKGRALFRSLLSAFVLAEHSGDPAFDLLLSLLAGNGALTLDGPVSE